MTTSKKNPCEAPTTPTRFDRGSSTTKTFAKGWKGRAAAYSLGSLVLVTFAKLAAFDYIGPATPFLLYFVAIMIAAWFGGWLWGIGATLISAAAGTYFFMPPFHAAWISDAASAVRSLVFVVEGLAITWIVTTRRSSEAAATRAAFETEAALARLQGVLGGVMDGISVQDENNELIYANEAAAKLSGFDTVDELFAVPTGETRARFELFDEEGAPLPMELLPGRLVLDGAPFAERLIRMRCVASQDGALGSVASEPDPGAGRWPAVRRKCISRRDRTTGASRSRSPSPRMVVNNLAQHRRRRHRDRWRGQDRLYECRRRGVDGVVE